jgi:uncharacterized protein YjbJ (UPF0337 family)
MNEDQVKGKAKDIAGKVQQEVGELVGSSEQQAVGDAKETIKDAIDRGNR